MKAKKNRDNNAKNNDIVLQKDMSYYIMGNYTPSLIRRRSSFGQSLRTKAARHLEMEICTIFYL